MENLMRNLLTIGIGFLLVYVSTATSGYCIQKLTIAYTGDTMGHVLPCGCSISKGGLARRAGMISELRKKHKNFILLDAGDIFYNSKSIPEVRAEIILKGMVQMGYDAVTLGEGELSMGHPFLASQLKTMDLDFVSSNVQVYEENKALTLPYKIIELDGFTIGVTGAIPGIFLDESTKLNKNIKVNSPVEALRKTVAVLEKKCRYIILLSHFGLAGTKNLLMYNDPGNISLAIIGHGRLLTQTPEKIGSTLIVQNSMEGESLGILTLNLDESGKMLDYALENIDLTEEVPEDKYLKEEMERFKIRKNKARVTERNRLEKEKTMEEQKEILQLSPEAFLKRMKND